MELSTTLTTMTFSRKSLVISGTHDRYVILDPCGRFVIMDHHGRFVTLDTNGKFVIRDPSSRFFNQFFNRFLHWNHQKQVFRSRS